MAGKVRITNNTASFESDVTQKSNLFLRLFAEQVVREAEPNTPKKTGDLRNRVVKSVLGLKGKIQWQTNYAIYQEKKKFKNYTTAGTGPNFARNAVEAVASKADTIMKSIGLI
jgi:hypothetical protein